MVKKKSDQQLIVQALNAAETNIKLAKTLLSGVGAVAPKPSTKDIPGITGTFDGENMLTEKGEKFRVNPNYASKSVLVYGDTLKKIEEEGQERFKQIARVKRRKVEGILAKKDGKWVAVTADGSYKVSPVAVEFYNGAEGDEVVVVIPLEDKNAPYAALESIKKEEPSTPSKPSGTSVTSVVKEVVKKATTKRKSVAKKKAVTKKPATQKRRAGDTETQKKEGVVAKFTSPEPKEEKPAAEPVENDEELR